MLSMMKKCLMAFALVFSVIAVVAAPIDFIPRSSVVVVRFKTDKVIANPQLSSLLSGILGKEMQEVGFTLNDLRGEAAIGFSVVGAKNMRMDLVVEFASPRVVGALERKARQEAAKDKDMRPIRVHGKRGFAEKDCRMIFYSDRIVIFQGFFNGNGKYVNLVSMRKSRAADKVLQIAIDVRKILPLFSPEELQKVPPQVKKISTVVANIDLNGERLTVENVVAFSDNQACNECWALLEQFKQDPTIAAAMKNVKTNRRGNRILVTGSMSVGELMALFMQFSQSAAPAGK